MRSSLFADSLYCFMGLIFVDEHIIIIIKIWKTHTTIGTSAKTVKRAPFLLYMVLLTSWPVPFFTLRCIIATYALETIIIIIFIMMVEHSNQGWNQSPASNLLAHTLLNDYGFTVRLLANETDSILKSPTYNLLALLHYCAK